MNDELHLCFDSDQRQDKEQTHQFYLLDETTIILGVYWSGELVHSVSFENRAGLTEHGKEQLAEQKRHYECGGGHLPPIRYLKGEVYMTQVVDSDTLDFYSWLVRYRGRDTAIGDLAYDVSKDPDFPRGGGAGKEYLLFYLRMVDAHPAAISTFLEAFRNYKGYREQRYKRMVDLENEQLREEVEKLKQLLQEKEN